MSLQVWLPLNGDLHNQGLSNQTNNITSTPNWHTSGKTSSTSLYTNTQQTTMHFPGLEGVSTYSVAYWLYVPSDATITNWADMFGIYFVCSDGTTSVERDELRNADYPGQHAYHLAKSANEGSNTNTYYGLGNRNHSSNTWAHYVLTKDNNYAKLYINGTLINSYAASLFEDAPRAMNGNVYLGMSGCEAYLNDFRIYDHVLSLKEIEEISKGLILHYKLDNNSWGQENLLLDTLKDINSSHTTYNITDFNFSESLIANEVYTVSAKINTSSEKTFVGFYHSGGSYIMGGWMTITPDGIYKKTFTATSAMASQTSGTGHGFCRVYVSNNPAGAQSSYTIAGTANVEWIKLEKGSVATQWRPNSADTLYTTIGMDNNIIYDSSGYNNNGTIIGNLTAAANTARYQIATVFNGSAAIAAGRGGMVTDAISVCCWGYMDNWSNYNGRLLSCTEGGGWNFEPSSGKMNFACGTGTSSNTYKSAVSVTTLANLSSGWHYFVGTYNGLQTKIYIDGILENINNAYSTKTPLFYNNSNGIFIGAEAAGSITTPTGSYFNGQLSDVRIYATALTDSQVKELYDTSMSIDSNGNIHTRELVEL